MPEQANEGATAYVDEVKSHSGRKIRGNGIETLTYEMP